MSGHAYSIDGQTFAFDAPINEAMPIGAYLRITTEAGRAYLGQVLETAVAASTTASVGNPASVTGRGILLAELDDADRPRRLDSSAVFGSATVAAASTASVSARLEATTASTALIELGEIQNVPGAAAVLQAKGFGRHTFLCGQSGSGKTYTLGIILERLLLGTDIRIAVIDPNSDFANIRSLRSQADTGLDDDAYRRLAARYQALASRIAVFGGSDAPDRLQVRFGSLTIEQQTMVVGLDPFDHPEEYNAFVRTVGRLDGVDYGIHDFLREIGTSFADDVRRLGLRFENLGLGDLSIWADADEPPIGEILPDDWRMAVMDLGSLPSQRESSIAAAAVLGSLWEQRQTREPTVIVIDEAHNICPQNPTGPNQSLATEHVVRIAGEGRKFGLYLLLATQRPEKVHQSVVSQCDNLILMRMNSATDIETLSETFSFVPRALVGLASGFDLGEGLAAGRIAPDPLLFRSGRRYTVEGGSDVPSTWARPGG